MMRDIWVISDTHFGHENIIGYCGRPFHDVYHMDEMLIHNWNTLVKDQDIVYHLGDVYMGGRFENIGPRLKGRKRLLLGNHDNGKDKALLQCFQKIELWRVWPEFGLIFSHLPLHPSSMETGSRSDYVNVHGHIHQNPAPSVRHINVSVENTNYHPVNIETLRIT